MLTWLTSASLASLETRLAVAGTVSANCSALLRLYGAILRNLNVFRLGAKKLLENDERVHGDAPRDGGIENAREWSHTHVRARRRVSSSEYAIAVWRRTATAFDSAIVKRRGGMVGGEINKIPIVRYILYYIIIRWKRNVDYKILLCRDGSSEYCSRPMRVRQRHTWRGNVLRIHAASTRWRDRPSFDTPFFFFLFRLATLRRVYPFRVGRYLDVWNAVYYVSRYLSWLRKHRTHTHTHARKYTSCTRKTLSVCVLGVLIFPWWVSALAERDNFI